MTRYPVTFCFINGLDVSGITVTVLQVSLLYWNVYAFFRAGALAYKLVYNKSQQNLVVVQTWTRYDFFDERRILFRQSLLS